MSISVLGLILYLSLFFFFFFLERKTRFICVTCGTQPCMVEQQLLTVLFHASDIVEQVYILYNELIIEQINNILEFVFKKISAKKSITAFVFKLVKRRNDRM